jgi:hypothetical protein
MVAWVAATPAFHLQQLYNLKTRKGGKTEISTFTDGEKIILQTHTHKNIRQKKHRNRK